VERESRKDTQNPDCDRAAGGGLRSDPHKPRCAIWLRSSLMRCCAGLLRDGGARRRRTPWCTQKAPKRIGRRLTNGRCFVGSVEDSAGCRVNSATALSQWERESVCSTVDARRSTQPRCGGAQSTSAFDSLLRRLHQCYRKNNDRKGAGKQDRVCTMERERNKENGRSMKRNVVFDCLAIGSIF
jgi:hypothetical protein